MFEKIRIKEHMEIVNAEELHVGTVDEVVDDKIKLTKSDSMDDMHHFLMIDDIEDITENRIVLKKDARIPTGLGNKAAVAS